MKGPSCRPSQRSAEAEGSLTLGTQGRAGSSPDDDGTSRHYQTIRVRQARREGVRKQKPVVEPPQVQNRLQPGGYGPDCSARVRANTARPTPSPVKRVGKEAFGESLRRTHGEAAGEKLGASPVERSPVNVGTTSGSPSPPINLIGDGQARRQPIALGWGGVLVVVGGQESWLQGEGGQRVRSSGFGRSEGRR